MLIPGQRNSADFHFSLAQSECIVVFAGHGKENHYHASNVPDRRLTGMMIIFPCHPHIQVPSMFGDVKRHPVDGNFIPFT